MTLALTETLIEGVNRTQGHTLAYCLRLREGYLFKTMEEPVWNRAACVLGSSLEE
jgi:hypothetical protein